jgi:hypothetical protein
VQRDVDLSRDLAIVLAGSGWHGGVLGLVASRLAERHSRPAIVLNMDGDSASGSGRSACGFDLHSAVEATRDIITRGGGHQAACGMTVPADKFEEFRARVLQCVAQSLTIDDLVPRVEADCEVTGKDLSLQLARDLEKLEPCGQGNPEAKLMLRGAQIVDGKSMGQKGEHLKWFINADGARFEAVWWRPGERAAGLWRRQSRRPVLRARNQSVERQHHATTQHQRGEVKVKKALYIITVCLLSTQFPSSQLSVRADVPQSTTASLVAPTMTVSKYPALRVGDIAPQFSRPDINGKVWDSREQLGQRSILWLIYTTLLSTENSSRTRT